jgi:hypothetical protein
MKSFTPVCPCPQPLISPQRYAAPLTVQALAGNYQQSPVPVVSRTPVLVRVNAGQSVSESWGDTAVAIKVKLVVEALERLRL